jgi:ABC-2 type transport system permease protein
MNIFLREMKANLKSFLFWCVGMIALIAASLSKYKGLSGSGTAGMQDLNAIFDKMPQAVKAFMGGSGFDLSTLGGYYGVVFVYVILIGAIFAVMLGSNIIVKEERDKTAEFLMVKPVSRTKILAGKLVAALIYVGGYAAFTLGSSVVLTQKFGYGENIDPLLAVLCGAMLLDMVLFLAIGAAFGALFKDAKKATGLSLAVLLATYFIGIAMDMTDKLGFLRYATPFKFFNPVDMVNGQRLEPLFVGIVLALSSILFAATFYFYKRRDLRI